MQRNTLRPFSVRMTIWAIDQPALARDSFRQWKRVAFRLEEGPEPAVHLFHKPSSSEAFITIKLAAFSVALVDKNISFSKKKKSPVFVQFSSASAAEEIMKRLRVSLPPSPLLPPRYPLAHSETALFSRLFQYDIHHRLP
jgi:hypothetical protein